MGLRQAHLTSGQTAVGKSNPKQWASASSGTMTIEVFFSVAAGVVCTALVIDLEGSITGLNYFALASHTLTATELTAKCCMFHVVDKPIKWIESNITTLTQTGVGDVSVTVAALSTD